MWELSLLQPVTIVDATHRVIVEDVSHAKEAGQNRQDWNEESNQLLCSQVQKADMRDDKNNCLNLNFIPTHDAGRRGCRVS